MNKHLSVILKAAACAGFIGAAGLSHSSAQQAPQDEMPSDGRQKAPHSGQSKGQMPSQRQPMPGQQPGDTTMTMERTSGTAAANQRTVTIVVKDVDRAANTVTFQAKVSPEANLQENGQRIRIDDLETGDALRVQFDPRSGEVMRAEVLRKARQ